MSKFIGRRIVPKHDGVWDISKEYEELSIVPVSYTHLDVYKRQGVASSAGGFLASAGTALAGLAGPAGIAVAAVGGIGLGLTALWKNCDGFREGVTNIWNKVTSVFTNGVNAIKNGISNAASAIGNVASSIWGSIKNVASSAVSLGKDIVGGIAGGIKKGVSWVGNAVKSVASGIRSFLHFSVPDEGPLADADTYICLLYTSRCV